MVQEKSQSKLLSLTLYKYNHASVRGEESPLEKKGEDNMWKRKSQTFHRAGLRGWPLEQEQQKSVQLKKQMKNQVGGRAQRSPCAS
jgi:hypothetical protein